MRNCTNRDIITLDSNITVVKTPRQTYLLREIVTIKVQDKYKRNIEVKKYELTNVKLKREDGTIINTKSKE